MSELHYSQCDWGDLIYGSKEQFQALGLGLGENFPGEDGHPRRKLWTTDPRGFAVCIERNRTGLGDYLARIEFPGWPAAPDWQTEVPSGMPGVTKFENCWNNEYVGTAAALVAAELVEHAQLPGMPGMRKQRVTILANGAVPNGPPTANFKGRNDPGARSVERASRSKYRVKVRVSQELSEQRREVARIAQMK